jgi:CBS domain-containing protein
MKSVAQLLGAKGTAIHSIRPDASVYECLALLAEKNVGSLLVMEGDRLVGIFTERDYARKVVLHGKSSKDLKAREVMSDEVLWVPSAPMKSAWR